MKIVVLISCMHQKDFSIIERSNIQTDVVVINQCDEDSHKTFTFTNKKGKECKALFISTTERGLSRSRNMALDNSWGDICIFCDDDEVFVDEYEDIIVKQFDAKKDFDIIAFKLIYNRKKFGDKEQKYNKFTITRVSSAQVAMRRNSVLKTGIRFDLMLGSGSGNGGGEENKFLFQLLSKGLKAIYVPLLMAEVKSDSVSQWFNGYTDKYYIDEGWCYRRILGTFYAYPLLWFHALKHAKSYKIGFIKYIRLLHKGFFEKRVPTSTS